MMINFIMIHRITSVLDHGSATKINDSGRMRTISQRIRSHAYEIDNAVRTSQWDKLQPLLEDLKTSTDWFIENHNAIFNGSSSAQLFPNATTAELDQIDSLVVPYQRLTAASSELQTLTLNTIRRSPYIDKSIRERIASTAAEISEAQAQFLPRMETIVNLFENRSRDEINESTSQARVGLLVLAFMLAGVVLFIIEPTILIVRRQLHELDLATQRARRADSVRWRLLTNMGHEFRTPMNAILGFTGLLEDPSISESERARLTESISSSAQSLGRLIETMLDMSAVESGQLRINPAPTGLAQLLDPCIILANSMAISKGLTLNTRIDQSCEREVLVDAKHLRGIIEKLIDNAFKFTAHGSITISARVVTNENQDHIHIDIADTGIGVDTNDQEDIFNAFHQAQDNLTRKFGGSGLGLAYARDLAKAMDGDITLESTPNKGSTFSFVIRAESIDTNRPKAPASPATNNANADLSTRRILAVDDAKDNRMLLHHYFKRTGADVEFAHDGQQAVEIFNKAIEKNQPFDIVLMDMQMPVLDGYAATRALREQGITTPIIAITAHALDGDREQCLDAGCNEYLTKPVNKSTLINTCISMITEHNEHNTSTTHDTEDNNDTTHTRSAA